MVMKPIVIVCPPNGRFSADGASAVMLNVRDAVRFSRHRAALTVVGPAVDAPFPDVPFVPVPATDDFGDYARHVVTALGKLDPALVELRQHMRTAERIARAIKPTPALLFRHNQVKQPKDPVTRFYRSLRLKPFDRMAFVSHFSRDHFTAGYPHLTASSTVAWNGLDTEKYTYNPAAKEKLIVFAGRIIWEKGVVEFAQAAQAVLARHPDWRVVITGQIDPGSEAYAAEVQTVLAQMDGRGTFLGYQPFEAVMDLFHRAEVVVVPSRWDETFGRTAMEALSNGAALISSGRGGLREVSGDAAVYVDPVTPDTLSVALGALLADPARRLALQQAGRARVTDQLDIRKTVSVIDDIRDSLLAR